MSTHNICFRGEIRKILCGYPLLSVAVALVFGSQGPGLEFGWKWNSAHECMTLHCTEAFIITLPMS